MSGSKKTIGIIAVLVTIVAVGAYFVGRPMMEDKQREEIIAFLEKNNLTAESVVSDSFGTGTTITKLNGSFNYFGLGTGTFSVDKLTVRGINLGARLTKGVSALVDDCTAEGLTVTISLPVPTGEGQQMGEMRQTVSADEAVLKNVRGDLNALEALDIENININALPDDLATIIAGFSLGELTLKNYRSSAGMPGLPGTVDSVFGTYSLKDCSILGCGPMLLENISVSMLGSTVVKIERVGADSMRVPNMLTFASIMQAAEQNGYEEEATRAAVERLAAELDKTPFEVKNFSMEKGQFRFMLPDAVEFDKLNLACFVNAEKAAVNLSADRFVVPPGLYGLGGTEGAMLVKAYGKPLDVSGVFDVEFSRQGGNGEILYKNISLSEAGLFSFTGSGELPFRSNHTNLLDLLENGGEVFLKKASVTFEDKGLISLAFRMQEMLMGLGGGETGGDLLRQAAIANAQQLGTSLPYPGAQKLAEAAVSLLQAPGTVTVTVAPEEPMSLDHGNPALLMPEVTYTPAK